ncbi:hypothetical protein FXO38_07808 [Capsicum annuum]|uniref:Fe2OG dioxygenase domain-containing protein n=1 Tax=Capsicum annuum TaxID=4072 RepID=A0A2G2ZIJ5_CAPAN|nr:hypothetical protein FXO37_16781 [Capsicum annuum]KAF3668994.1 hypothetical protein FXO38_07808 [Capsicum annuum]PHT81793.1 hypothetical protein T459_14808 [Capsicum annuum]
MCEGLGLEKNHFANELSQIQYMAINLYPTYPDPTVTVGAVEHNDGGVINMLLQELGGLHVRRQKDGQWFAVEPIPGALVCIGFEARIFYEISDKDVTPWNVLILGYMRFGHMSEAQRAFDMIPRRNFFTWSTLINGYIENKKVNEAQVVDVVSWTAISRVYVKDGDFIKGLELFRLMLNSGTRHNHFTFSTILDACSGHFAVLMVNQVHACFLKSGFPLDVVLLTSLVDKRDTEDLYVFTMTTSSDNEEEVKHMVRRLSLNECQQDIPYIGDTED